MSRRASKRFLVPSPTERQHTGRWDAAHLDRMKPFETSNRDFFDRYESKADPLLNWFNLMTIISQVVGRPRHFDRSASIRRSGVLASGF